MNRGMSHSGVSSLSEKSWEKKFWLARGMYFARIDTPWLQTLGEFSAKEVKSQLIVSLIILISQHSEL